MVAFAVFAKLQLFRKYRLSPILPASPAVWPSLKVDAVKVVKPSLQLLYGAEPSGAQGLRAGLAPAISTKKAWLRSPPSLPRYSNYTFILLHGCLDEKHRRHKASGNVKMDVVRGLRWKHVIVEMPGEDYEVVLDGFSGSGEPRKGRSGRCAPAAAM